MDKEVLNELFSSVQKDIAILKKEVNKSELRKKHLQRQVLNHIADVYPEEYKKIVGDVPQVKMNSKSIENIFVEFDLTKKTILGCSLSVKSCSFEFVEGSVIKNWILEGKLSQLSFIVEYATTYSENSSPENKEELITLQKLDIFPQSKMLEVLSSNIIHSQSLKTIIPCLYMFQKIQEERAMVEEMLNPFVEVEILEENDTIIIIVDIDSHKLEIKWGFMYNSKENRFVHDISVLAGNDNNIARHYLHLTFVEEISTLCQIGFLAYLLAVQMKYAKSSNFPILSGNVQLNSADQVLAFIEALFREI